VLNSTISIRTKAASSISSETIVEKKIITHDNNYLMVNFMWVSFYYIMKYVNY